MRFRSPPEQVGRTVQLMLERADHGNPTGLILPPPQAEVKEELQDEDDLSSQVR